MAENGRTPKKTRAVTALLSSRTIGDAAAAAGVGERTLARWLSSDEAFTRALRQAEDAAIDGAVRRLVGLQAQALDVLQDTLTAPDVTPTVRVRAACAVLDFLLRLRELRTLEERIAALEERATWQRN